MTLILMPAAARAEQQQQQKKKKKRKQEGSVGCPSGPAGWWPGCWMNDTAKMKNAQA
jgi:hypothetical protein